MTLSYKLFQHVVIQNKQLHQLIFSNITEVNRIRNNASSKCNCRRLGGAYDDLVFETYSLHSYNECEFYKYHRDILFPKFNTITLGWCCRLGTSSLLYDLVSCIYYSLINVNGSTPSSAHKYMKDNVLNFYTIYQLLLSTLYYGNVDVFKYLLQIADYTGFTMREDNNINKNNESNHQIVIKYQTEYPTTKYYSIFLRICKENCNNIIKKGIIESMKYGYVEQLQFLLELTKVSNVNSPLNTKEFLNYLMEVYSGHKLDCLKRSQSVYSSWKTTKQIKIYICTNQSLILKNHKQHICQKLNSDKQQEYQNKEFNTGTSKFYLVMLIMVEYIKSIMNEDFILDSKKYQRYNSVGNLASIYRDHQGIEYLLELGFPIEYVWDLESIKIIKDKNKNIPINAEYQIQYKSQQGSNQFLQNINDIEQLERIYNQLDKTIQTTLFDNDFNRFMVDNLTNNGLIKYNYFIIKMENPIRGVGRWAIENNRMDMLKYIIGKANAGEIELLQPILLDAMNNIDTFKYLFKALDVEERRKKPVTQYGFCNNPGLQEWDKFLILLFKGRSYQVITFDLQLVNQLYNFLISNELYFFKDTYPTSILDIYKDVTIFEQFTLNVYIFHYSLVLAAQQNRGNLKYTKITKYYDMRRFVLDEDF